MQVRRTVHGERRSGVVLAAVAAALALAGPAAAQVAPPVTVPGTQPAGARAAGVAQTGDALVGLFRVDEGECGDEGIDAGSWFRMVDPGGGYVENNDSPCDDTSWTPLAPGSDGGLRTGAYQPHPDPAFSGTGDALAALITEPQGFFGVDFSTATNDVDPQTGEEVPPPSITHDGDGALGGDVRAFAAAWSGQHFNQGSPKPDGSRPEGTAGPEGTYDAGTGRYTVEWSSRIEGGPFNGFTGVWHLTGTFEPAESPAGAPSPSPTPAPAQPTEPGDTGAAGSPTPAAASTGAPGSAAGSSSGLAGTGGTGRAGLAAVLALLGAAGLAASAAARRRSPA